MLDLRWDYNRVQRYGVFVLRADTHARLPLNYHVDSVRMLVDRPGLALFRLQAQEVADHARPVENLEFDRPSFEKVAELT
jgi:hypothetical protein